MTMDRSAHSRLAVTYRRISSLNQVDNNSMCAQEQAIKDYAKKNHLKIVEAFHDLAKSGTSVQNRTGYQQMMEYLEKHPEVTCVLLHHLDRLHRNVRNQLNDIYTLKCRGIAVVTTDGLNSMDEDCMSEILDEAASAEKYSRRLSKETMKGLRVNAEQMWTIVNKVDRRREKNQKSSSN